MTTVQNPEDQNKRLERRTRNQWTVMVYLAGDNNLAEEMIYALTSMNSVGSDPGSYEVFALYDAGVGPAALRIRNKGSADDRLDLVENADDSREKAAAEKEELAGKLLNLAREKAKELEAKLKVSQTELKGLGAKADDTENVLLQMKMRILTQELADARTEVTLRESDHKMLSQNNQAMRDFRKARSSSKAVEALGKIDPELGDSVDVTLLDFIVETIREHPAEHYMLILSGHGSGAVGDFLSVNRQFTSVGIPDLREVLKTVVQGFKGQKFVDKDEREQPYLKGKIDILGLDSCLMGMAEVAFEVRNEVDLLIGAEGFEPNTGWPYDEILKLLRDEEANRPDTLARKIVDKYIEFYSMAYTLSGVSTDMTALRLGKKIEKLANALGGGDGLSKLLTKALSSAGTSDATRDNLVLAHWEAQGFKGEQHVDVYDFCKCLQKRYREGSKIHNACRRVMDCFKGLIVNADYCGPAFQHSHGISIFFPWANITDAAGTREMDHYGSLEFAAVTHWDEFVKCYHRYTQRDARERAGTPILGTLNRREWLFTGTPSAFQPPIESQPDGKDEKGDSANDASTVGPVGATKFGFPGASKFGFPGASKFGFPGASKFGFPGASKFGFPGASKFGFPGASKFGFPGASKFGFPGASKFAGTSSFEIFKIASMKNPPIIWFMEEGSDSEKQ